MIVHLPVHVSSSTGVIGFRLNLMILGSTLQVMRFYVCIGSHIHSTRTLSIIYPETVRHAKEKRTEHKI